MEIKPVRKYAKPRFPTNEILEQHPEFLRIVPKRWRSNPVVLTALASVCLILVSARSHAADSVPAPKSVVAPIFIHGYGEASFGCMSVAPPMFLSETEAKKIITDEAKKEGIVFDSYVRTLKADTPLIYTTFDLMTRNKDHTLGAPTRKNYTVSSTVVLDGTDKQRNISYEFVSKHDFNGWLSNRTYVGDESVSSEDLLGAAGLFREGLLKAAPEGYCAVFYDPVTIDWGKHEKNRIINKTGDAYRDEIETNNGPEMLRAQVRDFIKWLKGQGVI